MQDIVQFGRILEFAWLNNYLSSQHGSTRHVAATRPVFFLPLDTFPISFSLQKREQTSYMPLSKPVTKEALRKQLERSCSSILDSQYSLKEWKRNWESLVVCNRTAAGIATRVDWPFQHQICNSRYPSCGQNGKARYHICQDGKVPLPQWKTEEIENHWAIDQTYL